MFGAAVLGLMLASALWWTYVTEAEQRGHDALVTAPLSVRLRMAIGAYFYAYILILLGVITLAAGLHLAIADIGARLTASHALLLGGGVGLSLAGDVGFRLLLSMRPVGYRMVGVVVVLAPVAVGVTTSALAQLVCLVGALVAMLVAESVE